MENKRVLLNSINENIGSSARMLGWSKGEYRRQHPNNTVYFNACIYQLEGDIGRQIWFGDVDVTEDSPALQNIADTTGEIFYLTPENNYRGDFHQVTRETIRKGIAEEEVIIFQPTRNGQEIKR